MSHLLKHQGDDSRSTLHDVIAPKEIASLNWLFGQVGTDRYSRGVIDVIPFLPFVRFKLNHVSDGLSMKSQLKIVQEGLPIFRLQRPPSDSMVVRDSDADLNRHVVEICPPLSNEGQEGLAVHEYCPLEGGIVVHRMRLVRQPEVLYPALYAFQGHSIRQVGTISV